ncbi:MAG TPA: GtrA family protein [Spirochaetota bacterium]|nr:GtrA family protein [Spirochaetota bacterium]HQA53422.1 GtrA family protein [Spirochaetota bacterium]
MKSAITILFHFIKHFLNAEFIRFLLTGGLNTLVGYIIFALAFWISGHEALSLVIDYGIGAFFNYLSYSKLVFHGYKTKRFISFIAIYIIAYLLNYGLVKTTMKIFGINAYIAQALALTVCPLFLYFMLKKFVFSNKSTSANDTSGA